MKSQKLYKNFSVFLILFLVSNNILGQYFPYYDNVKDIYEQIEIAKPVSVDGYCFIQNERMINVLFDKDGNEKARIQILDGVKEIKITEKINDFKTIWKNYKEDKLDYVIEENLAGDTIFSKYSKIVEDSLILIDRGYITKKKSVYFSKSSTNEIDTITIRPKIENNLLTSLEIYHGSTMTQKEIYKYIEMDKYDNWTKRIKLIDSESCRSEIEEERIFKYKENYVHEDYFEIVTTDFMIDGDSIFEKDIPTYEFRDSIERLELKNQEWANQIFLVELIDQCFYKKFFNTKFYFEFHITDKEEKTILAQRFFHGLKVHVWDYKDFKEYNGRTDSKRWFEGHYKKWMLDESLKNILPTGNQKMINGYNCFEYVEKSLNSEIVNYYYVSKELPFINYANFHFYKFDGFIVKSKRYFPDLGEVIQTVSIKPRFFPLPYFLKLEDAENLYNIQSTFINKK